MKIPAFALLVTLALVACGGSPPPPSASPPTLPEDAPVALVRGAVDSPIYDELRKSVRVVHYTGHEKVADHDLLVLDGDTHSPGAVKNDPLVVEALREGKWVLGLDLAYDHKREGLGDLLGAATEGSSDGHMVRLTYDAGHPDVWISETPPVHEVVGALSTSAAHPTVSHDEAVAYAAAVVTQLRAGKARVQAQAQDAADRPGLFRATFHFDTVVSSVVGPAVKNPGAVQTAVADYDHTYTVFLDNANNPRGNFQWVAVETSVRGDPVGGGPYACNACAVGDSSLGTPDEYAWFLDRQTVSVGPSAADAPLFTPLETSPQEVDGPRAYSADLSLAVGYTAVAAGAGYEDAYGYSNRQQVDLTNWKVSAAGANGGTAWSFRSASPLNADADYGRSNSGWQPSGYPAMPNDLSLIGVRFVAQALYRTSGVQNGWVSFDAGGSQGLADLYCAQNARENCAAGADSRFSRKDFPYADQHHINLAAVVPIPIKSVTFDRTTVTAGATVTGTVTLASPAVVDTPVSLGVDGDPGGNLIVPPDVTVRQGETAATFTVRTNANGLPVGGNVKGAVKLYSGGASGPYPLTVENLAVASLTTRDTSVIAGGASTGTVTLSAAASVDTPVPLSSDSPNVVVPASVTVPRGQASAPFAIETNAAGLIGARDAAVATLSAAGVQARFAARRQTASAGAYFSCGLKRGGTVACWGADASGVARPPDNLANVTGLSLGARHACALLRDGTVTCWGENTAKQATPPSGLSGVVAVAAGGQFSCALKGDGTVACWGSNAANQATPPADLSGVTGLSINTQYACALKRDGTVVCWGSNGLGRARPPAGLSGVTQVSAGWNTACALKGDGTLACWGDNSRGQATPPAGLSGVIQVGVGYSHTCALKRDGTVTCWGDGGLDQTRVPSGLSGVVGLSAGQYHTCALLGDGAVACWGYDAEGQTNVPPGLNLLQP